MGLVLGDVFRMADSEYAGEISKEQFFRTIGLIKVDIDQNHLSELFYALDTSLNGKHAYK